MEKDIEFIALKAMLKYVEFEVVSECCPVCGGNRHHDTACVLAAFLYPEKAESYKRETYDTHINEMTYKIENDKRFEFIRDELYKNPGYMQPAAQPSDEINTVCSQGYDMRTG